MKIASLVTAACLSLLSVSALAKLPAPPPDDPKVAAEKAEQAKVAAEKAKAAAEKTKMLQAAAEDRAVQNFQGNMKKAGKPVPKPTPIVAAQAPPAPGAPAASAKTAEKSAAKK